MKLVKALEEEERKQIEERRRQKEEQNQAQCDICLQEIATADLFPLDKCGHIYHIQCLERHVEILVPVDAEDG